jgi:signal transduction histidine kinase
MQGGKTVKKYEILLALSNEEPHSLTAIRLAIEDKGHKVVTATGSEHAVEALYSKDFDLVITDQLDILKRTKEFNPETIVIILSDTYKLTFVIKALQLDADDYVIKPIDPIELWHGVAHCLEKLEIKRRKSRSEDQGAALNEKILNMSELMLHDIRGSLVSMSATLKLLSRGYYGKMDEGVANRLNEVLSKTVSLIGLTEEYLARTFSLNGNGDLEAEGKVLDLMQDIINPVMEELSSELKEYTLRIHHRFDAMFTKKTSIKANRIWLKAVFRNLLKNAIKYGDKGGTIGIGFEDHGSFYRLNLYNTGKPIPEEYRNKLFTKFMDFGNHRNGVSSGMGLGLYLIKKIIQKQGGEIWYEPKEDGSNFVFTLPSELAFPTDSLLPIKPAQPRLAAVR